MENNYFFKKITSKHRVKRKMCLQLYYWKKRRTPIYITKTKLGTSKAERQMPYSTWRKLTSMNCNWTAKLQVTLLSDYTSWKKLCWLTFKASSGKVVVSILRKWRQNAWMKMWERVFFVKLKVGISQLHYRLTSSQTVFRDFK